MLVRYILHFNRCLLSTYYISTGYVSYVMVQQPYFIKLKSGMTPYSLMTPRSVALSLQGKVKDELGVRV